MVEEKNDFYMKMLIAANFLGPLVSSLLTYYMVRKNIGLEDVYKIGKDAFEGAKKSYRDLEYNKQKFAQASEKDI